MSELNRPYVGIVADCPLQRHKMQSVLAGYGLNISVICDPSNLKHQQLDRIENVECWVVEIDDDSPDHEVVDDLIANADKPILFGLGKAPQKHDEQYISWERRLLSKLEEHIGQLEVLDSEESIIALDRERFEREPEAQEETIDKPIRHARRILSQNIWVLAASLGGPAAIKEFLDEMPSNIRAGFLYAQHIDPHFSKVLTNVLGRHAELDLKPIEAGHLVHDGDVLVVPVDNEIRFAPSGIELTQNDWRGPYGPSIDHLLDNVFQCYGARCHVIVFSGMGNDGAMTVPRMKRAGCRIWTQTPASCANGSMPQSIIDLNCSDFSGTPKELAKAFIEEVGCHQVMFSIQENADAGDRDSLQKPDHESLKTDQSQMNKPNSN